MQRAKNPKTLFKIACQPTYLLFPVRDLSIFASIVRRVEIVCWNDENQLKQSAGIDRIRAVVSWGGVDRRRRNPPYTHTYIIYIDTWGLRSRNGLPKRRELSKQVLRSMALASGGPFRKTLSLDTASPLVPMWI